MVETAKTHVNEAEEEFSRVEREHAERKSKSDECRADLRDCTPAVEEQEEQAQRARGEVQDALVRAQEGSRELEQAQQQARELEQELARYIRGGRVPAARKAAAKAEADAERTRLALEQARMAEEQAIADAESKQEALKQAGGCIKQCAEGGLERAKIALATARQRLELKEANHSRAEEVRTSCRRHLAETEAREEQVRAELPLAKQDVERLANIVNERKQQRAEAEDELARVQKLLKETRAARQATEKRLQPLMAEEGRWADELRLATEAKDDANREADHQRRELMAARTGKQALLRELERQKKEWAREKSAFSKALLRQQQDIREAVRGNELKTRFAMITTNLLYGPMLRTLLSVFDCTHKDLGSCSMHLDVMPATLCFEDHWHVLMAALACTALMMLLPGVRTARSHTCSAAPTTQSPVSGRRVHPWPTLFA
eukprot:5430332-Prymnesium_polylepis.1